VSQTRAVHVALDPETDCIAVIMKHVAGNLRPRWTEFLTIDISLFFRPLAFSGQ
jgi:hypothetical protein